MEKFIARQGDVMLIRVAKIPKEAKEIAGGRLVLAEGEVTGHAHRIVDDGAAMLSIKDSATFVKLMRKAELVHEEHRTITLEPGIYEVRRQRTYTPQAILRVSD